MKKFLAVLVMGAALMGCDNKPAEHKAADTAKEEAPKAATETAKTAEEKK